MYLYFVYLILEIS